MTKTVTLGEICEIYGGGTPSREVKKYFGGGIPWLTPTEIAKDKIDQVSSSKETLSNEGLANSSAKLLPVGSVLMTSRASIGNIAIANNQVTTNQGFISFVCPPTLYNKYLAYWLFTNKSQFENAANGATFKEISRSTIKGFQIPLPALPEQRRIAALLDHADALRQKDRKLLAHYDQLAQSLFLELFGDPVRNEKGWEVKVLNGISSKIVDCPHSTPNHQDEPTNYLSIRTTDISGGNLVFDRMKYVNEKEYVERTRRLIPQEGDIIYGREGSFGDAIIVPANTKICLGQRVMLFRPDYKLCNSTYFWAIIRSESVYKQAVRKTAGSTVGHINVKDIINFTVPVPPLPLQTHFARLIEQIEKQKAVVRQQMAASEGLFGRLLQESFG